MFHTAILISGGVILKQLFSMSTGGAKKKKRSRKLGCCIMVVVGLNGPGNSSWFYLLWGTHPSDKRTSACKSHLLEKKKGKTLSLDIRP